MQEQATLEKELARLDREIETLSARRNIVLSLLGLTVPTRQVSLTNNGQSETDNSDLRKCADCGTLVPGPDVRGDCPACHAGPFEEVR